MLNILRLCKKNNLLPHRDVKIIFFDCFYALYCNICVIDKVHILRKKYFSYTTFKHKSFYMLLEFNLAI